MSNKTNNAAAYRIRIKQELITYKGGKCSRCGFDKDVPGAYDFHHRDPDKKEFTIGHYNIVKRERLFEEADKCDLVCRNCHAEIHDDKDKRTAVLKQHQEWLDWKLKPKPCPYCKDEFIPNRRKQKGCTKCYYARKRKVQNRPSKNQLNEMINTRFWTDIGREYGVSDKAVRKWAKSYGLL